MAKVSPFRALFYRPELDYRKVLSPPYDVISAAARQDFLQRSPYNIVRLILPDNYPQAADTFQQWLAETTVFERDNSPAFYWCRQEYELDGKTRTSQGLIARLRLEDPKTGSIRPHEDTIPSVRRGQFQFLCELETNFCPIITLYQDTGKVVEAAAERSRRTAPPIAYQDDAGVKFSLRRLPPDPAIAELFERKILYIADGHHRYASAYRYSREKGTESAAYVLTYFLNSASEDTAVFPFHRYLAEAGTSDFEKVRTHFSLTPSRDADSLLAELKNGWLGLAFRDRYFRFPVPEGDGPEISFLHQAVLGRTLGYPDDRLAFEPDSRLLSERLARDGGMAFFTPPLSLQRLYRIWERRAMLPRKSTYFYPKIPSGLVIYKHDPAEQQPKTIAGTAPRPARKRVRRSKEDNG